MGSAAKLTYQDLLAYPEDDGKRRELFDGVLVVTPAPHWRHQDVLSRLLGELYTWARGRGRGRQWRILPGPVDLLITPQNVLEPDLVALRPGYPSRLDQRYLDTPPDLVVEIASPSTRRRDLTDKAATYARFGVPEYWFVDHDRATVVVHRIAEGGLYETSTHIGGADLTSSLLPGFRLAITELCAPPTP